MAEHLTVEVHRLAEPVLRVAVFPHFPAVVDEHTGEQRPRDCTEAESPELDCADPVPDGEREEDRDHGILLQRRDDPDVAVLRLRCGSCTCRRRKRDQRKPKRNNALWVAEQLGIKLHIIDIIEEYKDVVINPKHGYGANLNPCLDCKIFMVNKAHEWSVEHGFDFIITGEVVGQRPMSQRKHTMPVIARDSGAGEHIRNTAGKREEATAARGDSRCATPATHRLDPRGFQPEHWLLAGRAAPEVVTDEEHVAHLREPGVGIEQHHVPRRMAGADRLRRVISYSARST